MAVILIEAKYAGVAFGMKKRFAVQQIYEDLDEYVFKHVDSRD